MKKQYFRIFTLFAVAFFSLKSAPVTLTQNDFYPLHSTFYPFDFLNENAKEYEKGTTKTRINERMRFTISGFGQKADRARDQNKVDVPAGDVRGRWNMLGLLYGTAPSGQSLPSRLTTAAAATYQDGQRLDHENYSDVNDNLGHFSIPLKYRKVGARFGFHTRILQDFVVSVEGGLADIKQIYTSFNNTGAPSAVTTDSSGTTTAITINPQDIYGSNTPSGIDTDLATDRATIADQLMDPHELIFEDLGYDIKDFHTQGAEDCFISFLWRHNFHVNNALEEEVEYDDDEDDNWEEFIFTPFFKVTGILAIGKDQDPNLAFSIPFGNNGHHGVSLATGFSMDFYESIEFAFDAGTSHFFKREISGMRVPNDERQTGVFPFKTDVSYDPGKTWHFSVGMNAYRFMDKLSCYAQYLFVTHSKDTIKLLTQDAAFVPNILEDQTKYAIQAANFGFTYELSPHIKFGFAWQAPISRRGAYKTNTFVLTLAGTF